MSKPLNTIASDTIQYNGPVIFDGLISSCANMNDILLVLDQILRTIYTNIDTSCIDLTQIGIDLSTPGQEEDDPAVIEKRICEYFNAIGEVIATQQETIVTMQVQIDELEQTSGQPGQDGTNGVNGLNVYNGAGAPSSSLGVTGELYIDYNTGNVYSKNSGVWTQVFNIKGSNGLNGTNGQNGTNGTNGADGQDGRSIAVYTSAIDPSGSNTIYPGDVWIVPDTTI